MKKYYYHSGINPAIHNPIKVYHAIDRTETIFNLPEIEILTPIGKLCQPKSIDEMCFNSARNIVEKSNNQKIFVAWSGGIDSTLALTELMKITPHDQIVVLLNDNSILEYPDFYIKYIKDKFETRSFNFYSDNTLRDCIKEGIVVTGHTADSIFGDPHIYKVASEDRLKQTVDDFLKEVDTPSQKMYNDLIQASPRKIVDVKDLFWWLNYALSYQFEQLCVVLEIDNMTLGKNIFHFCDNDEWNDYSVSTSAEEKYEGYDYRNFKMPLKNQLHKFIKDDDYTFNKIKVHSWRKYRTVSDSIKNKPVYITTDWKRGWGLLYE